ncbi:MAG: UDP-glucose 4-epimerase GalE [Chloroflexi bacterium]|nr:UDP-glucose 4-epimerase GalE [Chloroflexota bacterium]
MPTTVLVVGGAGYIGSHTVRALIAAGYQAVVFDSLENGHRAALPPECPLIVGDLGDRALLDETLAQWRPDAVIHFAGYIEVGRSVADPRAFYHNNIAKSLTLLDALIAADAARVVFSSSASVYGQPDAVPIPEDARKSALNPYAFSKTAIEQALADYGSAYGVRSAALRYFNAAGADPAGDIGEDHPNESHLIPLVLDAALGRRSQIAIFGDDYPTPDGTCIRDYVHVNDLAQAHLLAVARLLSPSEGDPPATAYNVGTGRGYSNLEVLETCRRVTGLPIPSVMAPRRPGDGPELVADCTRIKAELGWNPVLSDLETIVATAWQWRRAHPHGYAPAGSE